MILYHGTNVSFSKIDICQSRLGKDFGVGFYLTPDKHVATRQGERKYSQTGEGAVVVKAYRIDDDCMQHLRVLRFDSYTKEWARFIFTNRQNRTSRQIHDYDVVIGPIADDTVGFQIRRLEDGIITEEQFLEEIRYHRITIQYLFATQAAIDCLREI